MRFCSSLPQRSKLTAREEPAEKRPNGNVWRICSYGRDGREPFALSVGTLPKRADTVTETIDAVAKSDVTHATRIAGLGADAVGYIDGADRAVMAVVPFKTELRAVLFNGPRIVPQDRWEAVARHVIRQI